MLVRTLGLAAGAALGLYALFGAGAAPAVPLETLDEALVRKAPEVLDWVRKHHYRNVGVLKFLVRKGKGPLTDNAGTLNLDLARRLELALILDVDADDVVGVFKNASAVAARIEKANHLTAAGRLHFFKQPYRLAWGERKVEAAAFLTGEVQMSDDLRTVDVIVRCFGKKGEPEEVTKFRARAGADELVQGGESFLQRREEGPAALAKDAVQVQKGKQLHPLHPKAGAPVLLKVLYGRKPVRLAFKAGQAWLPEPQEGQKVRLVVERTPAAGLGRLGVVLKVNGENTLYRERREGPRCSMWVLKPGRPPLVLEGFQEDAGGGARFKVLSRVESRAREMNYGADVGTITLEVYREKTPRERAARGRKVDTNLAILGQGALPEKPPANVGALRAQLMRQVRDMPRRGGIIEGEGGRFKRKVKTVPFNAYPTPILAASVVYYRPGE
jgi:hypothetical protein